MNAIDVAFCDDAMKHEIWKIPYCNIQNMKEIGRDIKSIPYWNVKNYGAVGLFRKI